MSLSFSISLLWALYEAYLNYISLLPKSVKNGKFLRNPWVWFHSLNTEKKTNISFYILFYYKYQYAGKCS